MLLILAVRSYGEDGEGDGGGTVIASLDKCACAMPAGFGVLVVSMPLLHVGPGKGSWAGGETRLITMSCRASFSS